MSLRTSRRRSGSGCSTRFRVRTPLPPAASHRSQFSDSILQILRSSSFFLNKPRGVISQPSSSLTLFCLATAPPSLSPARARSLRLPGRVAAPPPGYDVGDGEMKTLTKPFHNGLIFCALIHKMRPKLIDFASLSKANGACGAVAAASTSRSASCAAKLGSGGGDIQEPTTHRFWGGSFGGWVG